METWSEYIFFLPDRLGVTGFDGRRLLARLLGQTQDSRLELPKLLFNHWPKQNETVPFRIEGRKKKIIITAVGNLAAEANNKIALTVSKLLGDHFGEPLLIHKRCGTFYPVGKRLVDGFSKTVIFAVKPKHFKGIRDDFYAKNLKSPAILSLVEKRLLQSLQVQVESIGGEPDEILVGDISIGGLMAIKIKDFWVSAAKDVRFRTNLGDLKQPWHVGYFKNYGYGRIFSAGKE